MYTFNSRDLLEEPEKYFYANCSDPNFIDDWVASRKLYSELLDTGKPCEKKQVENIYLQDIPGTINTISSLNKIHDDLDLSGSPAPDLLLYFLGRFEITKRLFSHYIEDSRKPATDEYRNINTYLIFANCLSIAYKKTGNLQYLSTMNKVMDSITSLDINEFDSTQSSKVQELIAAEIEHITGISR